MIFPPNIRSRRTRSKALRLTDNALVHSADMPVLAGNRVGRNIAPSHSLTGRVRSPHAQSRPQAKKHRAVNDMSLEGETNRGLRPPFFFSGDRVVLQGPFRQSLASEACMRRARIADARFSDFSQRLIADATRTNTRRMARNGHCPT